MIVCCFGGPTFHLLLVSLGRSFGLLLDEPPSELILLFLLPDLTLRVSSRQALRHHLTVPGRRPVPWVVEALLPSAPGPLRLITDDGLFRRPPFLLLSPVKEVQDPAVVEHLSVWEENASHARLGNRRSFRRTTQCNRNHNRP